MAQSTSTRKIGGKWFNQHHVFDFTKTFSYVIKLITTRVVLTIAISKGMYITQFDMNNAFLNGILHEEVYITISTMVY